MQSNLFNQASEEINGWYFPYLFSISYSIPFVKICSIIFSIDYFSRCFGYSFCWCINFQISRFVQHFTISMINQSINQFYFLLSATSWMPLALYSGTHTLVWTHTYTYTVKYITHTSIHTRQPFRRRYNVFISGTHTLTLVDVASGPRLLFSW